MRAAARAARITCAATPSFDRVPGDQDGRSEDRDYHGSEGDLELTPEPRPGPSAR